MNSFLPVWIEALDSKFTTVSDLITWVDRQIIRLDDPPLWMLDASLAKSHSDASAALRKGLYHLTPDQYGGEHWDRLHFGFCYLRYQRNEISMLELLLSAGQYAEGGQSRIACETFYYLANEIDDGGPVEPSDRPLNERVAELFGPFAEFAHQEWQKVLAI